MKFHRYERQDTRRVLAAMILRTSVLARIASKWRPELFGDDDASSLVGGWAVAHFERYGEAPGLAIQQTFEEWEEAADSDLVKRVEKLLHAASSDSETLPNSSEVILDFCGRYFQRLGLEQAHELAGYEIKQGRLEAAEKILENRSRLDFGTSAIIKPGFEESLPDWQESLEGEEDKPLISYPRGLGRFFSDSFCRDSFSAIMGASGRAKSFWLLDFAYRGVRQRNKVAYFECGDLSKAQVMRRMAQRALGLPRRARSVSWPAKGWADRDSEPRREEIELEGVSPHSAQRAWAKVSRNQDRFRLECSSNSSVSAFDIAAKIAEWEKMDGWVPDIVVIDYADILAVPPGYTQNPRDGINENWKRLRKLSQDWHCCVITATQSDAASYDANIMRRRNFTDDRRKFDHVTSYFAINQTAEEKEWGVQRLNCLKQRNEDYGEGRCCWVAGCLDVGRPWIRSIF